MKIKKKVYPLEFIEQDDYFLCELPPLPIVGKGSSPAEALSSLVKSIPEVYEDWADGLSLYHVEDTKQNALPVYKELTYMVTNFSNDEQEATYYTPLKA
jgi:hypothetical protein